MAQGDLQGAVGGDVRLSLTQAGLCLLAAALLSGALVRLEFDELLGYVVVVALGEDAQDGEARLVHVDAFAQRQPAGDAAFGCHVLQLQDGHAHGAVLSREAVVLHAYLELVALWAHLVTQGAVVESTVIVFGQQKPNSRSSRHYYSQSESFVVFGSPAVVLRLGGILPLLVAEVRANDVDLHKWPEYPLRLPPQVIGSHH